MRVLKPQNTVMRDLAAVIALSSALVPVAAAQSPMGELRNWFDTPFDQAVSGSPMCPRPLGPLITQAEMRIQGHGRIERGTSCWLAKKCEDSNAYRRDAEVQQRVLQAIRSDGVYASASVWITTERRYVTLQGCVGSATEQRALITRVGRVEGVEHVFDQLIVGTRSKPRWSIDPAWVSPPPR